MKKLVSLLLVISLIAVMFAFAACSDETDDNKGNDTQGANTNAPADTEGKGADTEAPADTQGNDTEAPADTQGNDGPKEYGPNEYPYDPEAHDVLPMSILPWTDEGYGMGYGWGAPDATSIYLPVDPENVIHDGKGTWGNDVNHLATNVFDLSDDDNSIYDCDEGCSSENDENMDYGIILEDWNNDTEKTGYVGAYYEQGVHLTQIRWLGRTANPDRYAGGYFEASEDGTTWTTLATIEENQVGDFIMVDVPEEYQSVTYKYVRYVSPKEGYCNMNELEFWGSFAA